MKEATHREESEENNQAGQPNQRWNIQRRMQREELMTSLWIRAKWSRSREPGEWRYNWKKQKIHTDKTFINLLVLYLVFHVDYWIYKYLPDRSKWARLVRLKMEKATTGLFFPPVLSSRSYILPLSFLHVFTSINYPLAVYLLSVWLLFLPLPPSTPPLSSPFDFSHCQHSIDWSVTS